MQTSKTQELRNQIDTSESVQHTMQITLNKLKDQITGCAWELQRTTDELNNEQEVLNRRTQEVENLREAQEIKEDEVAQLVSDLEKWHGLVFQAKERRLKLTTEQKRLASELDKLKLTNAELRRKISENESAVQARRNQIAELDVQTKSVDNEIAMRKEELGSLNN